MTSAEREKCLPYIMYPSQMGASESGTKITDEKLTDERLVGTITVTPGM